MTDNSGRSADALNSLKNVSLTPEGGVGGTPDFIGKRKRAMIRAQKRFGYFGVMRYMHEQAMKRLGKDMMTNLFGTTERLQNELIDE